MTTKTILTNAKLVMAEEIIHGTICFEDGQISSVDQGTTACSGAIDCDGDYVSPGLIELHTDNLERHIAPRPKVDWPHTPAILAHDAELSSVGITTVFDAIRVGSILSGTQASYPKYARNIASEIQALHNAGALKISHRIHLRAEVCSETLLDELDEFGPDDRVGIVSLMDHTPGQRQFRDITKMEAYVRGKRGLSEAEFEEHVARLMQLQSTFGKKHEVATVEAATRYGATLASHDDTTEEQVGESAKYGVSVAEFPTTVEAAKACRNAGIDIIMGAPNLVRGGSHSGNVAAADLAKLDLLDIVSSDYVPSALMLSAVQLGHLWDDMARGIATVTRNPARVVQLDDRGQLDVGQRADVIRFKEIETTPVLRGLWVQGAKRG